MSKAVVLACWLVVAASAAADMPWNGTTGVTPVSSAQTGVAGDLFWWFFPPRNGDAEAPLVIWLQGGPGASSIELGLLKLHGPYAVSTGPDGDPTLVARETTWNEEFATLYVDQPIGTGYSTSTSGTYASTQTEIAGMLVDFLETFYEDTGLWPAENGLVVAGESYGGHYCPTLGAAIAAKQESTPIQLLGVSIGDGLTDPALQVATKPAAAFAFGLVDEKTRARAQREADAAAQLCAAGEYVRAKEKREAMERIVMDASGVNAYDVRLFGSYDESSEADFLNLSSTRDALNVPNGVDFGTDDGVSRALVADVMRSYKSDVLALVEAEIPVLLYQGQFDWKDGSTSNAAWIESLFPEILFAKRTILKTTEDSTPYGWIKRAVPTKTHPNLVFLDAVISSAGHMVPFDQPVAAKDMITRFIREWAA